MKNLVTLCLAIVFMVGIQNALAQTKEETVDWLNNYGSNNLSADDGRIVGYIKTTDNGDITLQYPNQGKFVFNASYVQIDNSDLNYDNGNYTVAIFFSGQKKGKLISGTAEVDAPMALLKGGNLEKTKKVYTAIMHLAKLNGAREKPNADTF